jgi:hypothetical protein
VHHLCQFTTYYLIVTS